MLLILWMMLMHTAFPHVHHEHEEHTHHGVQAGHSRDRHDGQDAESAEKKSLFDFFSQNHTHSNHLPQSISVNQEKSDLVKEDQRKVVTVTDFSKERPPITQISESDWLENWDDPLITSPFFSCNSLRGPPVLV